MKKRPCDGPFFSNHILNLEGIKCMCTESISSAYFLFYLRSTDCVKRRFAWDGSKDNFLTLERGKIECCLSVQIIFFHLLHDRHRDWSIRAKQTRLYGHDFFSRNNYVTRAMLKRENWWWAPSKMIVTINVYSKPILLTRTVWPDRAILESSWEQSSLQK